MTLGNSYDWSSTTGIFTSNSSNPNVQPNVTQTYTLTETISATGCYNSNQVIINVNPLPVITFDIAPNFQECQNSPLTYSTQTGKSNYIWSSTGHFILIMK